MRYRFSRGETWHLVEVINKTGNIWNYTIIDSHNKTYIGEYHHLNYLNTIAGGWTIEEDKEYKVLEILRQWKKQTS